LNARIEIAAETFLFGIPSFSYKTKIFFEDSNTPGLEQGAYGLVNFRGGIDYKNFTLAIWGNNLSRVEYIFSAGNTGSLFGNPTQIPGIPLTLGTTLNWKF
jgi:outer membrane receptor protein involved in Fe transport